MPINDNYVEPSVLDGKNLTSVDDILNDISEKKQTNTENAQLDGLLSQSGFGSLDDGSFKTVSYGGGFGQVFQKDVFGSGYSSIYPDYEGTEGNEDRIARDRSFLGNLGRGLVRGVGKTGIYALGGTVGLLTGVASAISNGDAKSLWDNPVSNFLDDADEALTRNMAQFYTNEQKSKSFLGKMFTTTSFWTGDLIDGAAFLAGAFIPAALTGGISLESTLGRTLIKAGLKKTLLRTGEDVAESVVKSVGDDVIRGIAKKEAGVTAREVSESIANGGLSKAQVRKAGRKYLGESLRSMQKKASIGAKAGGLLDWAKFSAQSSFFEAGMEARQYYHDSAENFMQNYINENGKMPSYEESERYLKSAVGSGNVTFVSNLALLTLTNAAMFGKVLGLKAPLKAPLKKSFNKIIGAGIKGGEKGAINEVKANVFNKVLGQTYFALRKPISEGFEEGSQNVIQSFAKSYTDAKYEGGDTFSYTGAIMDAVSNTIGTKQGRSEIFMGMLIGALAPNFTGRYGIEGIVGGKGVETYSKFRKDFKESVEKVNKTRVDAFRGLNRTSAIYGAKESDMSGTESYQETVSNYNYIKSHENIQDMEDVVDGYNTVVDSMKFNEKALSEVGMTNEEYQQHLKEKFKNDYKSYRKANNFVENIGLDNIKTSNGNITELKDHLVPIFMLGEKADEQAKIYSDNISELLHEDKDGVQSYLGFESVANDKSRELIGKYREQKEAIKGIESELLNIQAQREQSTEDKGRSSELSAKYTAATQRLQDLRLANEQVGVELNNNLKTIQSDVLQTEFRTYNVDDIINEQDKINNRVKSLEKLGLKKQAKDLKNNLYQYAAFMQTKVDLQQTFQDMHNTNFFSSKKGKSFINSIIGKEYKPSDENLDKINNNFSKFRQAGLNLGYNIYDVDANTIFSDYLKGNDDLSDREKYKFEAMATAIATSNSIQDRADEISAVLDDRTSQTEVDANIEDNTITIESEPIEGDTVPFRGDREVFENLNTIERLEEVINQLTDLMEGESSKPTPEALKKIKALKEELDDKNKELQKLLKEELEDANNENAVDKKDDIDNIKNRIQEIENEINATERPFKFTQSSEYRRIKKLLDKDELTDEEANELEALKTDMENWFNIMGIRVEGVRLSDLVEQLVNLKNLQTKNQGETMNVDSQEIEANFNATHNSSKQHLDVGLIYSVATATFKNGEDGNVYVEIANITPEGLNEVSGLSGNIMDRDDVSQDPKKGNILIGAVTLAELNNAGSIHIALPETGSGTLYSSIYRNTGVQNENGENIYEMLDSDYNDVQINEEDTYNLKRGQKVTFRASMDSDYNKGLFKRVEDETSGMMTKEEVEKKTEKELSKLKTGKSKEALKIKEKSKEILSLRDGGKKNKGEIKKLEAEVKGLSDTLREKANKKILKENKIELSKELKDDLRRNLLIEITDEDGNVVNILKATREVEGIEKDDAQRIQSIRDSFVNEIIPIVEAGEQITNDFGVKVDKLYMGFVNYNTSENGGAIVKNLKQIETSNLKKNGGRVVDMGVLQNGKIKTKNSTENINTDYLNNQLNTSTNERVPVVIVEMGSHNIALPVSLPEIAPPVRVEDMNAIMDNDQMNGVEKSIELNKLSARAGLDTSNPEIAFISAKDNNQLDRDKFNNIVGIIENKSYLSNVNDFLEGNMEDVLPQAMTYVDLNQPVKSPKIRMDMSNIKVIDNKEGSVERKTKSRGSVIHNNAGILDNDIKNICN